MCYLLSLLFHFIQQSLFLLSVFPFSRPVKVQFIDLLFAFYNLFGYFSLYLALPPPALSLLPPSLFLFPTHRFHVSEPTHNVVRSLNNPSNWMNWNIQNIDCPQVQYLPRTFGLFNFQCLEWCKIWAQAQWKIKRTFEETDTNINWIQLHRENKKREKKKSFNQFLISDKPYNKLWMNRAMSPLRCGKLIWF